MIVLCVFLIILYFIIGFIITGITIQMVNAANDDECEKGLFWPIYLFNKSDECEKCFMRGLFWPISLFNKSKVIVSWTFKALIFVLFKDK